MKLKRLFQKFLILPLLKPCDIKDAFKILQEDVHKLKPLKSDPHFHRFLNYFNRQWMQKVK